MSRNPSCKAPARRRALLALAALAWLLPGRAQEREPVLGTPGKDAGWIPTPAGMVEALLQAARVSPSDYVVDLGSGDGRIPILAAKQFGARALGIEFNAELVAYSERAAAREGVAGRVRFVRGDIFETDFSEATLVTLFMPPAVNMRLRPRLLAMKPGTRIASYIFAMDDWEPDEWVWHEGMQGMLWVVPARVAGEWHLAVEGSPGLAYALHLDQRYQRINGYLMSGSSRLPLFDARLEADRVRFTAVSGERRMDFEGAASGDAMEGRLRMTGEPIRRWRGTRAKATSPSR